MDDREDVDLAPVLAFVGTVILIAVAIAFGVVISRLP